MNCPDFDRIFNDRLDAGSPMTPGLDPALEAHAASCPSCRSAVAGYQLLGRALATLAPPPPASADSIGRLRSLRIPPARTRRWSPRAVACVLASAATILALAWPFLAPAARPRPGIAPPAVATSAGPRPIPARPIDAALADATRATLDLARAASAPAARIGREALDLREAEAATGEEAGGSPTRLLEAVGERVNAGVRPIPGSARRAFGFLLGPISGPPPSAPASHDTL